MEEILPSETNWWPFTGSLMYHVMYHVMYHMIHHMIHHMRLVGVSRNRQNHHVSVRADPISCPAHFLMITSRHTSHVTLPAVTNALITHHLKPYFWLAIVREKGVSVEAQTRTSQAKFTVLVNLFIKIVYFNIHSNFYLLLH